MPLLSADALTALRRAAALAHSVGGITLRVVSGGELLVTVVPPAERPMPPTATGTVVDACTFRRAVAAAWADQRAGSPVAVVSADPGSVDLRWSVAPPGRPLGFGAVRTRCADRTVWAMASLLDASELTVVLHEIERATEPAMGESVDVAELGPLDACLTVDDVLGVSIVHLEAGGRPSTSTIALLDEVMRRIVAAAAATELVRTLTAIS
jgi:hypothetical protein